VKTSGIIRTVKYTSLSLSWLILEKRITLMSKKCV
jgi:hypothetical protein